MLATVEFLRELTCATLHNANRTLTSLGDAGREEVGTNRFGNTVFRGDIACEETVIETFRNAGVDIRILSEEHGTLDVGEGPELLGILDGLDGSGVYKRNLGGRYGTMLGIFQGIPHSRFEEYLFEDYLVSGIIDHSTGCVYLGTIGKGVDIRGDRALPPLIELSSAGSSREAIAVGNRARGYIDRAFPFNLEAYAAVEKPYPKGFECLGSSSMHYADLASGEVSLVLECTRKGNLEIAVAYGLVHEAGSVMLGPDGRDIGPQRVLDFARDRHVPIISALNMSLAQETLALVPEEFREV